VRSRPRDKRKRTAPSVLRLALAALVLAALPALAGQVSVGTTTPVEIGAHDQARYAVSWINQDATNPVYCSTSSAVTSSTGMKIAAGNGYSLDSCQSVRCQAQDAVYCIATGSSVTVGYFEDR
jgi:hypothetical protein